jgi:hypothetical protein
MGSLYKAYASIAEKLLIGPGWNLFDVRRPVEAKPS